MITKQAALFLTHQLPKGLQVDEAVVLGKEIQHNMDKGKENEENLSTK
jgi:hypothetical protein